MTGARKTIASASAKVSCSNARSSAIVQATPASPSKLESVPAVSACCRSLRPAITTFAGRFRRLANVGICPATRSAGPATVPMVLTVTPRRGVAANRAAQSDSEDAEPSSASVPKNRSPRRPKTTSRNSEGAGSIAASKESGAIVSTTRASRAASGATRCRASAAMTRSKEPAVRFSRPSAKQIPGSRVKARRARSRRRGLGSTIVSRPPCAFASPAACHDRGPWPICRIRSARSRGQASKRRKSSARNLAAATTETEPISNDSIMEPVIGAVSLSPPAKASITALERAASRSSADRRG
jgi:hypothetical protein